MGITKLGKIVIQETVCNVQITDSCIDKKIKLRFDLILTGLKMVDNSSN